MDEKQFARYKRCLKKANVGCSIEFSIPDRSLKKATAEIVGIVDTDVDITGWGYHRYPQGRIFLVGSTVQVYNVDGTTTFWSVCNFTDVQARFKPKQHNHPLLRILRNPDDGLISKIIQPGTTK